MVVPARRTLPRVRELKLLRFVLGISYSLCRTLPRVRELKQERGVTHLPDEVDVAPFPGCVN